MEVEDPTSDCSFRHIGDVIDPDDGLVWRWEKDMEGVAEPGASPNDGLTISADNPEATGETQSIG